MASLRFLIGEAGQTPQMTPIGAGPVAAVEPGQFSADGTGQRRLQRCDADLDPGLEVPGVLSGGL